MTGSNVNRKTSFPTLNSYDSDDADEIADFLYGNGYLGTYLIRICSYNVNCKFDKNEMYDKWLSAGNIVDIMAIGFQELYFDLKDILSPDPIFHDRIAIPPHKKWIDFFQSLNFIKDNYNLLLSKSFAGLCLIIFLRKQKSPRVAIHVTNLLVGSVPIGMLGMANKGALAISFRIGELNLCFINCHLPAGADNSEKRQFGLQAVIQKLQLFQYNKTRAKKVNFMEADIDVVYVFGDLNFRVQNLTSAAVINKIIHEKQKAVNQLLQSDELIILRENDVLYRCFHEGQIEFQPTYKFLLNSNTYQSKRVPSFCDRILWMGSSCLNIAYSSHPEFTFSDHKPISGDFLIDLQRLKKRKSDKFVKILQSPRIRIESTIIDFGSVYFMKHSTCERKITNVGQTTGEILFKNIESHKEMPTWFTIIPATFSLEPKQSKVVQFRIYIDSNHVSLFNRNALNLNSQLICVSVINGIDTPLTFHGEYHVNIFGIHLEVLKYLDRSVDTYSPKDIVKFENLRNMSMNSLQHNNLLERILDTLMPRMRFTQSFTDIILQEMSNINEILDLIKDVNDSVLTQKTLKHGKQYSIGVHLETLLIYMKCLPQPIIPFVIQARLATGFNDRHHIVNVLHSLPKVNIMFLKKLFHYFHEFVRKHDDTKLIASLIVSCIPPSNPSLKDPLTTVISSLINKPNIL